MANYTEERQIPSIPYDLAEVEDFLHGVDYPATKREILDVALDNGAPDDILVFLNSMPDREYLEFSDLNNTLAMMLTP